MSERGDALAVAELAVFTSNMLEQVDRFTIERGANSNVANRINKEAFVAPLRGQSRSPQASMTGGYIPEALVQQMVPDTTVRPNQYLPSDAPLDLPTIPTAAPLQLPPVVMSPVAVGGNVSQPSNDYLARICLAIEAIADTIVKKKKAKKAIIRKKKLTQPKIEPSVGPYQAPIGSGDLPPSNS